MMQFGIVHSGWSSGNGSGWVTSSAGAADHAVLQRPHEIVGDDVLAAGDVDDPGVALHHLQLGQRDHLLGLGRQRQGQHDEIGTRQRIDVSVGGQHLVDAIHLLDPVADDGDVTVERLEHAHRGRSRFRRRRGW